MEKNYPEKSRANSIYTLAQSGTNELAKPAVILRGKGSEVTSNDYGNRKGKKKMISLVMALNFIDIAKEKGHDVKPFWNTYHCLNRVYYSEGKIYGNYCKNRICTICTAIRKADKINKYFDILKEWKDAHFLTLTLKSVRKDNLRPVMQSMLKEFSKIVEKYRKRAQRTGSAKLVGIRSLESNFNPEKCTYNPHIHLIVADKKTGEIIRKEWLNRSIAGWTNPDAQYLRKVADWQHDLFETFKYGTKIFTTPKAEKGSNTKESTMLYSKACYNIIRAMSGLRIFDRFGFNLPKIHKSHNPAIVTTDYQEWIYLPEYHDWQNVENELTLLGYEPDKSLSELLSNKIDKERE